MALSFDLAKQTVPVELNGKTYRADVANLCVQEHLARMSEVFASVRSGDLKDPETARKAAANVDAQARRILDELFGEGTAAELFGAAAVDVSQAARLVGAVGMIYATPEAQAILASGVMAELATADAE